MIPARFRNGGAHTLLPLTAMVDVLFLLIIFLVLGADFDTLETVRLPQAHGEARQPRQGEVTVQLAADGVVLVDGKAVPAPEVLATLRGRNPARILLLPDEAARVGGLFQWYEKLGSELGVPVLVGVRPGGEDSGEDKGRP